MVVVGLVHLPFVVDGVEVCHEQHLGEGDGIVAGLLGHVDLAGSVLDFLVQGEDQTWLLASFSRCGIRKRELYLQGGSISISSQGFLCNRDLNTQEVENKADYLGIQRQVTS